MAEQRERKVPLSISLGCCIAVAAGSFIAGVTVLASNSHPQASPILMHTCLITPKVSEMVNFYERVLGIKAHRSGDDYAEFRTSVGVLAIFSAGAQETYIPGSAIAASNRSAILEFQVTDVDEEYVRLQPLVKTWVKKPTTQPWGTRSLYFRDPDGNLINFYMLATTHAETPHDR